MRRSLLKEQELPTVEVAPAAPGDTTGACKFVALHADFVCKFKGKMLPFFQADFRMVPGDLGVTKLYRIGPPTTDSHRRVIEFKTPSLVGTINNKQRGHRHHPSAVE